MNIWPPCSTAEGRWRLKPWRQGAVTKGEEKDSEKKGAHSNPAEKIATSPLYNQAPELLLFPLAVASHLMHDHELLCRSQAPLSQTKVSRHKTPAAGVTAPVPFSGTSGRKSKVESKYPSPCPCKEVRKRPAFQKQSTLGLQLKLKPVKMGIQCNHSCWDNIQYGSLESATYRSPKPAT